MPSDLVKDEVASFGLYGFWVLGIFKVWSNGCGVVKEILRIWSGENAIRFRKQKSAMITATKIEKICVFQSQIWVMLNFKERNQESRPSITTSQKMIGRAIKPLYNDDLGCVLHQPSKQFLHYYIFSANTQSVFSQNQENMSQSGLISKEGSEKKMVFQPQRLKISVPHFDNLALIQGYSKTLIGRCMNPRLQDMKALIYMLPRIWKMEERVAGADLGLGRFQLDFDNEEDIVEVLKAEPFHFDYWMISLVRWEPVMAPNYPWAICFWVRVMGVPLQFWADPTFRSIGDGIGETKEIDLDGGRVRVIINGFKPLVFETIAEFYNGEEALISLRYEKLFGYCRICFSLCHDQEMCPERVESKRLRSTRRDDNAKDLKEMEHEQAKIHQSYKGAVNNGRFGGSLEVKEGSERVTERHDKGEGKMYEERHFSRPNNTRTAHGRDERKYGGGSSSFRSSSRYAPSNRYMMDTKGLEVLRNANFRHGLTDNERLMLEAFHGKGSNKAGSSNASKPNDGDASGGHEMEPKKVRKELRFEVESQVTGISSAVDMENTEVSVASLVLEDNLDSNEVMQKEEDPILEEMENERDDTLLDVGEKDSRVTDVSVDGKDIGEEEHVQRELIGTDKEEKEKKQGVKKKTLNVSSIFVGRTAKKRMVQALISPRKKVLAKNIGRPGKNTGLEVAKNTSNSGTGIDSIHLPDT